MNILENCFDNYIDIIVNKYNLNIDYINDYVKDQNWNFKVKKEKYLADIYHDNKGNKYYLIDNILGIKIIV